MIILFIWRERRDENYENDADCVTGFMDGSFLALPNAWRYRKFNCLAISQNRFYKMSVFQTHQMTNKICRPQPSKNTLYEIIIVINESDEEEVDFAKKDFFYILEQIYTARH